jgi:hypothetical protein
MSGNYAEGRKILVRCMGNFIVGGHGEVPLSDAEYSYQMSKPDSLWYCPECMCQAIFVGVFHRCLSDTCDGWASEDTDQCDTCGVHQQSIGTNWNVGVDWSNDESDRTT